MSEFQRHGHRGLTELVGERDVLDRTREHHASQAERCERQSELPRRLGRRRNSLLERIDHHLQRGFLRLPDRLVAPGDIIGQADQGATPLHILEVLAREIVADELGRAIRYLVRGRDAFELLAHKAAYRLGIELALALKITVEATSRHPGASHDVVDRGGGETVAVKQLQCAVDDALPNLFPVMGLTGHPQPRTDAELPRRRCS